MLKQFLKRRGISAYELGKAVDGISPKTVYMYVSGQRQPSLDALDRVIAALRDITGEEVQVGDIIVYRKSAPRSSS